eukprot:evm.model.scf_938.6 EVM.evm.TU.scf_938.6   scf_938:56346-58522(-)
MLFLTLDHGSGIDRSDKNSCQPACEALEELLAVLERVLEEDPSHRNEARLLLTSTISDYQPAQARQHANEWFAFLLPRPGEDISPGRRRACQQWIQLLFEKCPEKGGQFLSEHPEIVKAFFKDDRQRIPLWFSHFSLSGFSSFRWGARALANYVLANRETAWKLLHWEGRHPQAPVMVASKPHYFCELNVTKSVENLLQSCPDFWDSEEMKLGIGTGEIFALDNQFFSKELYRLLCRGGSMRSADWLQAIMKSEPLIGNFKEWAKRVLSQLSEEDLMKAVSQLHASMNRHTEVTFKLQLVCLLVLTQLINICTGKPVSLDSFVAVVW